MASNNNDNSAWMGVALVITAVAMMAAFVFAVLAFVALVLTVLALIAWDKPLTLGKDTLQPHEARRFVYHGLIGAAVLPVFVLFCGILLHLNIQDGYWFYIILGGYIAGSIGMEFLMAEENEKAAQAQPVVPLEQLPAPPREPEAPKPPRQPFEFADWDDEEEHR